ncbi:MAG: tetratricopeptide repeat protein [Verrucomicrobiae bacterium]|nr:tetratricopeptide repeat protein [Verrucomicrobiae bacterium]
MKAIILTLIAFLALLPLAQPSQASFGQANELAKAEKWPEAIAAYKETLNSSGPTAAALYNLGNAHYANGDTGRAILSWEQAKLAAPNDADIAHNLSVARRDTGTENPQPPAWQTPAFWLSLNGWATTGSLALAALAAVAILSAFGVKVRGQRLLCLTAVAVAILGTTAVGLRAHESRNAIIVAADAPLRISPFDGARPLDTLAPGTTVQVLRKHGSFTQIVTSDGNKGWINDTAVESVLPADAR